MTQDALKSMTAEESLRKLIKAAVELVIIRHLQSEEDGEELDIEFLAADTANACFGVDTCAMEPIPELAILLRRLRPECLPGCHDSEFPKPIGSRIHVSDCPVVALEYEALEPAVAHSSSAGPEPRCPKCGHNVLAFNYSTASVICDSCRAWYPVTPNVILFPLAYFAQFFPAFQQVDVRELVLEVGRVAAQLYPDKGISATLIWEAWKLEN